MNVKQVIAHLQAAFPKCSFRDGAEFDRRHSGAIWTGESSVIDITVDGDTFEMPAFNYYDESGLYVFGVYKPLADWLLENDLYAEAYDAGTFFIYPI